MISAILRAVGGQFVDSLLGKVTGVFESYFKKEVSLAELRTQLLKALLETAAEIEKAHAEALAKTYASFMQAVVQSKLMQVVWGTVVISQTLVLLWHQIGIPALCFYVGNKACYPSSGTTVEWAYLLVVGLCGLGPVMLRSGHGAGGVGAQLKSLIGK